MQLVGVVVLLVGEAPDAANQAPRSRGGLSAMSSSTR
jgi:hypothetical protein